MKTPDQNDLWRDVLDDVSPAAFEEASLRFTVTCARRVRRTRCAVRLAAGAAAAIAATFFGAVLVRSPRENARSDRAEVVARVGEPKGIPVRYITDEELLLHFDRQSVALVHSSSSCEFLVLDDVPAD
jgi:hypothetical protein